jgi:hypothetical protein
MIQVKSAPESALAGVWDAAVLGPVREINEQVVDVLCEAAAAAGDGSAGLLAVVREEFLQAPAAARRRLASCPYLLLDAGFGESARWARPLGVRDAPAGAAAPPGVDCGVGLTRRALVLGWHLARSNRLAARVALGMTPACAELVGSLRLADLESLAETDRAWVRLRWENRAELWRPLLRAALPERTMTLAGLQMRGLQLLAAEDLR